jgi:signal peptidase I
MSLITGVLYAALLAYLGGWYMGQWQGNFSLLLFILTVVTLLYWLAERYKFLPARQAAAERLVSEDGAKRAQLAGKGITQVDGNVEAAKANVLMQPWWLDWTAGLFPVICAVFFMRSFLFEPFKIPSGSMIPTLLVGDLILVNKFHYGIRLPVINTKVLDNHDPERGDVIVFRYPVDTSIDYIKRVVAIPGDEVAYINKRLSINGKPVDTIALPEFYDEDSMKYVDQYTEKMGELTHKVITEKDRPPYVPESSIAAFPYREQCNYSGEGVVCKVPAGHFFAMGDNRDNSLDSRYWGFVPQKNIVGKAFFVWMNFGHFDRIGKFN